MLYVIDNIILSNAFCNYFCSHLLLLASCFENNFTLLWFVTRKLDEMYINSLFCVFETKRSILRHCNHNQLRMWRCCILHNAFYATDLHFIPLLLRWDWGLAQVLWWLDHGRSDMNPNCNLWPCANATYVDSNNHKNHRNLLESS